jgi:hypothetical protein
MLDDAKYLRAQAQLCLEIARNMSCHADAECMRQQASEYTLRAEKLEDGTSHHDLPSA